MVADRLFSFACLRTVAVLRAVVLAAVLGGVTVAQEVEFDSEAHPDFADLDAQVPADECEVCSSEAAKFDQWEGITDESSDMVSET